MHGRVKQKITAKMQEKKRREQQKKAEIFSDYMKQLLIKKKEKKYEDDILKLSSNVISMCPDVVTAWNARKEYFLNCKNNGVEILQGQIDSELKMTETALRMNPKSYCTWYHRYWILNTFNNESRWAHELKKCEEYLKMDDRNLHTWDYRRIIADKNAFNPQKELDYTTEQLNSNFSNYAAWHFRSKWIPKVYPIFDHDNLCSSEEYRKEIDYVSNAVYTDPDDQSAWLYHRWLLCRNSTSPQIIQAGYEEKSSTAWVVIAPFQKNIVIEGLGNDEWKYLNNNTASQIMIKNVANFSGEITLKKDFIVIDRIDVPGFETKVNFRATLNEDETKSLKNQLDTYETLLQMEPTPRKWVLLAVIVIKEQLGQDIDLEKVAELMNIDNFRKNYYTSMISRLTIERELRKIVDWTYRIEIPHMSLTGLYHSYMFTNFKEVDISNNPLGNEVLPKLVNLLSCKKLNLSNCKLTSISSFPVLRCLELLVLSSNEFVRSDLPEGLLNCPTLNQLYYSSGQFENSAIEKLEKAELHCDIVPNF